MPTKPWLKVPNKKILVPNPVKGNLVSGPGQVPTDMEADQNLNQANPARITRPKAIKKKPWPLEGPIMRSLKMNRHTVRTIKKIPIKNSTAKHKGEDGLRKIPEDVVDLAVDPRPQDVVDQMEVVDFQD